MNKSVCTPILVSTYIFLVAVMLVLSYFFSFLLPIFLVFLCVLTALAATKTKWYIGGVACGGMFATLVLVIRQTIGYICMPVYALLSLAIVLYLSRGKLGGNIISLGLATCFGLVVAVVILCLQYMLPPIEAGGEYIRRSQSEAVYKEAKNYLVYEQMLGNEGLSKEEYALAEQRAIERVGDMDRQYVISNYAVYVESNLRENILFYISLVTGIFSAISAFFATVLYRIKSTVSDKLKKFSDWSIPKGYTLGVALPLVGVYVLGLFNETMQLTYWSLAPLLILIPYGVCGMSIVVQVITRNGKYRLFATLIVLLLLFIYPVFVVIGIIDKIVNIRKIIKIIDDTEAL